jgi:hypothetical protein
MTVPAGMVLSSDEDVGYPARSLLACCTFLHVNRYLWQDAAITQPRQRLMDQQISPRPLPRIDPVSPFIKCVNYLSIGLSRLRSADNNS